MIIYKITNLINGKLYIGKTTGTMKDRFQRHLQDAISNRLNTHLARAIRKDGAENFTIELVEIVETEEELNQQEKYWIKEYDSYKNGYNETEGGDGGNTYSSKTPEEMEIIKEKIRNNKIGSLNPQARPVKCLNSKTNEEIHFGSAAEVRDYFGETNHNFVIRRCKRVTNYMFRGVWKIAYEEDEYNPNYSSEKSIRKRTHNHIKDMITGEEKDFNSYTAAEKYFNMKPKTISDKAYLKDESFIVDNRYKITVLN